VFGFFFVLSTIGVAGMKRAYSTSSDQPMGRNVSFPHGNNKNRG
jgi:hypothetical protein